MARRQGNSSYKEPEKDDSSVLDPLSSFSQSVDKFDSSSQKFSGAYEDNTTRLIKSMEVLVRAFDKDISGFEGILNKNGKTTDSSYDKYASKLGAVLSDSEKNFERQGSSFNKTLGVTLYKVADYAVGKFESAFSSIINNFNDNFTYVTQRMDQTAGEYSRMLKDSTDWIRENDLKTQFSQIDWTKSLTEALSTGLRGEYAQQLATQTMISERLLPQVSTTTKAYTRMSKLIGDQLTEATTAIGQYTQQVYGAEGLEDNQLNELLETSYREIAASIAERGGTKEEFAEIWSNYIGTYQQYANQYGSEYATQLLSDYKDFLTGEAVTGNNIAALSAGTNADLQAGDSRQVSATTFADFAEAYADFYAQYAGQTGMATYAGVGNYNMYLDQMIGDYFGEALESWDSYNVDYNEEYAKKMAELSDGKYQSITAQQQKWNENLVSKAGDIAAQYLPDTLGALNLMKGIMSAWFTAWLSSPGSGKGGSGNASMLGNLNRSLATGTGSFTSDLGAQMSLLKERESISDVAMLGRTGLSTAGKLLSGASIAGGLVWGGVDAYKAGQRASAAGGDVASSAIQGFFTGSSTAGMSSSDKAAYYEQSGYKLDWGDVAGNAGKYALVGGGAGTLAGGPMGTLIGTVAGVATGAVVNMIDQAIEMSDYKKFNKAITEVTESIEGISQANTNYEVTMDKTGSALGILNDALSENGKLTEQQIGQLANLYPEYARSLQDTDSLDKDYLETLKTKIEREQYLNELNAYGDGWQSGQVGEDVAKDAGVKTYASGVSDFTEWVKNNPGANYSDYTSVNYEAYGYKSETDYVDALKKANVLSEETEYGSWSYDKPVGTSIVINTKGIDDVSREVDQAKTEYGTQFALLSSLYDTLDNSYLTYTGDGATARTKTTALSNIKNRISDFSTSMENMKSFVDEIGFSDVYTEDVKAHFPHLSKIYELTDQEIPAYRSGADRTVEGFAYLHDNESVLTSRTASQLRDLAEGSSLSGYVDKLYASKSSPASVSSEELSSQASSLVVEAINQQTEQIVEQIKNIISIITPRPQGSPIDRNLVTFKGVSS